MKWLNFIIIMVVGFISLPAFSVTSQAVRLHDETETHFAKINPSKELTTTDSPNLGGVDVVFNLTTTPVELKIGASAKVNRKYVIMEALTKNVKWGFNSSCNYNLKKSSFFMLPVGENTTVYIKASTGTAQMTGGEI